MISPEQLDQLLTVMVKHQCLVLKHGDLEIHTAPSSIVGPQPGKGPAIINPYNQLEPVHSLADLDALYGVPSIEQNLIKEGE